MIDETIEELKQIKQTLEELQEQYNYAVEQLVIYEKALKMACDTLYSNSIDLYFCDDEKRENGFACDDCRVCLVKFFINRAKEELGNE